MLPDTPNLAGLLDQGFGTTFNKLTRTKVEIVVKSEALTGQIIRKSIVTSIVHSSCVGNKTMQLTCLGASNE